MLKIYGYCVVIILRASLTLAPLSLTIAEKCSAPIESKTSAILLAKNSPVCTSLEKLQSLYKYSLRSEVIIIKFQIE